MKSHIVLTKRNGDPILCHIDQIALVKTDDKGRTTLHMSGIFFNIKVKETVRDVYHRIIKVEKERTQICHT